MVKATNLKLTPEYLKSRADGLAARGYSKPKWISFCEDVLAVGLRASLYEARRTFSKYVTVTDGRGKSFKIRFSNHKPIKAREAAGDCDFFVGVTNQTVTNTDQVLAATLSHFNIREAA